MNQPSLQIPDAPTAEDLRSRKRINAETYDGVRRLRATYPRATFDWIAKQFGISRSTVGAILGDLYEDTMEGGERVIRRRRAVPSIPEEPAQAPAAPVMAVIVPAWRALCYGCKHWGTEQARDGVTIRPSRPPFERAAVRAACGRPVKRFPFGTRPDGKVTSASDTCDAHTLLAEHDIERLIPASERGQ